MVCTTEYGGDMSRVPDHIRSSFAVATRERYEEANGLFSLDDIYDYALTLNSLRIIENSRLVNAYSRTYYGGGWSAHV